MIISFLVVISAFKYVVSSFICSLSGRFLWLGELPGWCIDPALFFPLRTCGLFKLFFSCESWQASVCSSAFAALSYFSRNGTCFSAAETKCFLVIDRSQPMRFLESYIYCNPFFLPILILLYTSDSLACTEPMCESGQYSEIATVDILFSNEIMYEKEDTKTPDIYYALVFAGRSSARRDKKKKCLSIPQLL